MNVDSRKKATVASIASGAPKMSPTYFEYSAQFMPNWNSRVMPVTTPRVKLIRNSSPPELRHPQIHFIIAPDIAGLHIGD